MSVLVFDIETNGLKPDILWMVGVLDYETNKFESYTEAKGNVVDGLLRLLEADILVGHNILSYDCKVIRTLTSGLVNLNTNRVIDTLLLSRRLVSLPNHKLKTWGELLGFPKGDYNDWTRFSPEMEIYCQRDCEIASKVFAFLNDLAMERGEQNLIESALAKSQTKSKLKS